MLETNGILIIITFDRCSPATPEMLGLTVSEKAMTTTLISDGRLLSSNLKKLGLSEKWLFSQLRKSGISNTKDVFLMTVDTDDNAVIIKREQKK